MSERVQDMADVQKEVASAVTFAACIRVLWFVAGRVGGGSQETWYG